MTTIGQRRTFELFREIIIVSLGLIFCGLPPVYAAQVGSNTEMRSISGIITGIDIPLGRMQISSDRNQDTRGISEYTVNLSKTLVTNTLDDQYLVVKDLRVGQRVIVELINNSTSSSEEVVARNIIVNSVSTTDAEVNYNTNSNRANLVGPRGEVGPAGPAGSQGPVGPRGQTGEALRGPRGEVGPAGLTGEQGFDGPRGPMGNVERGPAGDVGPTGPAGRQGDMGRMGERGGSAAGYAGPTGASGPQGNRGPTGDRGPQGSTLYGPQGPAGYQGVSGQQGIAGNTGSIGENSGGAAGLAGPSGPSGPSGRKGEAGVQGNTGRVGNWESYKEFNFTSNQTELTAEDTKKLNEIASYMRQNPSLRIGIDGTPLSSRERNQNDLRVRAIQNGLINAGVESNRIRTGTFEDRNLRREGRIAVLFSTI